MDSQISRIRAELSLPQAWKILGLPGEPKVNCDLKSPFRQDKKPSFRIYEGKDHLRFFDHGDASGGDVCDLWAIAKGIDVRDALHQILDYLGDKERPSARFKAPQGSPERVSAPEGIRWPPDIRTPQEAECRALAALRGLSSEAFFLAGRLGTLKVATVYSQKSWIITDAGGRCAEARRFDGAMYTVNGKQVKSFCLPGSKKDLPLGLKTRCPHWDALNNILLVEGMPDYFAALQLAIQSEINFRPIAVLGAGLTTFSAAQQYLAGKKILIICHNDQQGQAALPKWIKALYSSGAQSVKSQALPFLHDDLNDFLQNPGPDQPLDLLKGFANASPGATKP